MLSENMSDPISHRSCPHYSNIPALHCSYGLTFYNHSSCFAPADADGSHPASGVSMLHGIHQRYQYPCPASANRMTESDSAAVHIHLCRVESEHLVDRKVDDRECLINLKQIDIILA